MCISKCSIDGIAITSRMIPDPVNCLDFRWITHVKLNAWAVALISLCVAVISAIMSGALMLMLPYGDPEILVRDLKVYIILLPVPIFLIRDLLRIIAFLFFGDVRLNRIIFAYPFAGSGIFSHPNHLLRINAYKSCLIFPTVITVVIALLSLLIYPSLWAVFLVGMTIGWSVSDVWLLYRLKDMKSEYFVRVWASEIGCDIHEKRG